MRRAVSLPIAAGGAIALLHVIPTRLPIPTRRRAEDHANGPEHGSCACVEGSCDGSSSRRFDRGFVIYHFVNIVMLRVYPWLPHYLIDRTPLMYILASARILTDW